MNSRQGQPITDRERPTPPRGPSPIGVQAAAKEAKGLRMWALELAVGFYSQLGEGVSATSEYIIKAAADFEQYVLEGRGGE